MTDGIEGKVVVVTGAGSGIGAATARRLAAGGAKLVLAGRGAARLEQVAASIAADGGTVAWMAADVATRDGPAGLVDLALKRFGRLDVLVSNAGVAPIGPFDDLAVDDWDRMIDINLRGVLYGIAAALPVFRRQTSGHFVTVISTAGLRIVPGMGVYAATKNAVRTVMEGLRQESRGDFRVTGISPGFVRTDLAASMPDPGAMAGMQARMAEIGLDADAVARSIAFTIAEPDGVDIGDLVIRPTVQD
ncbi:SDR family oxidoreductase [Tistrella mobilis]